MAAAATALADRQILSRILHHLSEMKYKERRQYGPDQPVEFLEFRPTLVPSILVNKLWADVACGILWRRYPHLTALKSMSQERRQYYAEKVQRIFSLGPPSGSIEAPDYLDGLTWPNLKCLEFELDFRKHVVHFATMFHDGLEKLELSGYQSGDSKYFVETLLPMILKPCKRLKSLHIGPETIPIDDPIHVSVMYDYIDACPNLECLEIKSTGFMDKDSLFARLSQRTGLKELEIDLEPGLSLLPLLGHTAAPLLFASLKRLSIMCYPEIASSLPKHLQHIEELQFDVARIPNCVSQSSDWTVFEDILAALAPCTRLRALKIGVGLLAADFPSSSSLPRLSGAAIIGLAEACPRLEDISLLALEPSAIDGTFISSLDFDRFCRNLPRLRTLSMKFHPATTTAIQKTALQSLGRYCSGLEILRLKVPFQLPSLPVPRIVPQILISSDSTPESHTLEEATGGYEETRAGLEADNMGNPRSSVEAGLSSTDQILPLFPNLTHLALSRGHTLLAVVSDTSSTSASSHSTSEKVEPELEPELEANLVRSWAYPLLIHFPKLEILEAWGDWMGHDNESLNYFLPTEEILASTWEFLSGVEQDLWDEDGEEHEGDSWDSLENGEDWEKASLINEFIIEEPVMVHEFGKLSTYEEEPDGMITPGRTFEVDGYFPSTKSFQ